MQKTEKKHTILHLPKWYPHSADLQNGVFIQKQISALVNDFVNAVLFVKSATQNEDYLLEYSDEDGVQVFRVYFREYGGSNLLKPLIHTKRYLHGFQKGLKAIIREHGNPQLIHAHVLLRSGLLAWYYSRKFTCRYLVSEHWSGFITGTFQNRNAFYRYLVKFVMTRSEKILLVSKILKSSFLQLGIPEKKIELVPNVVEVKSINEMYPQTVEREHVVLLSVADLVDEIKKISEVIEVVADLSDKIGLELWIVGDGPDRKTLEQLATSKGLLDDTIKFFGRKTNDEVLEIISQCDFLVMNSVIETFSVVTAEALLAGKPVVATRCGGPEVFVNETNGILIDPGNRDELREAILQMIEKYTFYDPEVLKLGVKERFSAEAVGLQLKSIYNGILGA